MDLILLALHKEAVFPAILLLFRKKTVRGCFRCIIRQSSVSLHGKWMCFPVLRLKSVSLLDLMGSQCIVSNYHTRTKMSAIVYKNG